MKLNWYKPEGKILADFNRAVKALGLKKAVVSSNGTLAVEGDDEPLKILETKFGDYRIEGPATYAEYERAIYNSEHTSL